MVPISTCSSSYRLQAEVVQNLSELSKKQSWWMKQCYEDPLQQLRGTVRKGLSKREEDICVHSGELRNSSMLSCPAGREQGERSCCSENKLFLSIAAPTQVRFIITAGYE